MLNLAYLTMENAKISKLPSQYQESASWFRKLTMMDPTMAEPYFYLGLFHEHGLGNDRDFRSAYNYYKKAARLNHAEAISKCGDFLYSGRLSEGIQNRAEALKCYKKAAEMNCPSAINNLALMIESENKSDAMDLFKKAHKMGNVDATVNLAFAYHDVSLIS